MTDTIAAISTGQVLSAIGLIRLTGEESVRIADEVFFPYFGGKMSTHPDRSLVFGEIRNDNGEILDICLCTISHGPNSYTGEHTAEFQLHGSPVVIEETLALLFKHGARQALAGEFTKRAFLNGRMDLTQAEAVIDLIHAETPTAANMAANQLNGSIYRKVEVIYTKYQDIMSHFHAVLDYPDEDIEDFKLQNYKDEMSGIEKSLATLLATFERGKIMRDGIKSAIIGRPNVGKSSLLNALLGYDRAIVTDIPGTTRDTIEEKLRLGHVTVRLIDTAGLRKTDDTVESMGVDRSLDAMREAELAIFVFDASEELTEKDSEILDLVKEAKRAIAVINKTDLDEKLDIKKLDGIFDNICKISAKNEDGLGELEQIVCEMFPKPEAVATGEILTNARQAQAVETALCATHSALEAMNFGLTPDAVLTAIEDAMQAIALLTGKVVREDITDRIFERFCVGK